MVREKEGASLSPIGLADTSEFSCAAIALVMNGIVSLAATEIPSDNVLGAKERK